MAVVRIIWNILMSHKNNFSAIINFGKSIDYEEADEDLRPGMIIRSLRKMRFVFDYQKIRCLTFFNLILYL